MAISGQATSVFAGQKGEGDVTARQDEQRQRYETAQQGLWDPALYQAEQQRLAAQQYGLEAEQMRTAAQQQLGAGIQQTRSDLMAGAGARGLNPALGRAAGYAGGQLGQRGVGMARTLQARELAAAQAQQQQALAAQAGLQMGLAEQALGAQATESQALQAYQALAAQRAAAQQQQALGYGMAGLGAAGTLGAMIGGGWGGGGGQQGWSPEYQQQYQQWAQTYSDRALKTGVKQALTAQEAALLNALRAEGQRTESALDAAVGRGTGAQQAAVGTGPAGQMLSSLSGTGRQYQYTPQAQQQLGQPAGTMYGPMAQDLAKTELGRSAVVETPAGLAVDTPRLGMITAGLVGEQQRQIEELRQQLQAEGRKTEARLGRATR
jgi:hypothetical protein